MNKAELRKLYLSKRSALDVQSLLLRNEQIKDLFLAYFHDFKIEAIHTFLPIPGKNEINTKPILDALRRKNPKLKVVVSKSNLETFEMTSYLLQESTVLEVNRWGIPEPIEGVPFDDVKIDIILMPLLIFDKSGQRVGYGKGFYDRFLKKCRPGALKVGLSLEPPVHSIGDTDPNDVVMNYCVTPERVYDFIHTTSYRSKR